MSHILVVCARRYNGHELWTALGIIQARGHTFDLVSTDYIIQDEITMQPNRIERIISEVTYGDRGHDAFMIVSGNMADTEAYWRHPEVLKFIEDANKLNHPIAAICCSVPTIRETAKEKRVSFFPLLRSRELLKNAGAILTTVALTRDKNLVTAEHQMASEMWAEEFCNLMEGKPTQYNLIDSGFVPMGNERKPIPAVENIKNKGRKIDGKE